MIWVLALLLPLVSCSYEKRKGSPAPEKGSRPLESKALMGYRQINAQLIGPKCLGCHGQSGGNQGGTNLETYESVVALLPRIERRSLIEKNMPPGGGLSAPEEQMLSSWIAGGAPLHPKEEGERGGSPGKTTGRVRFSSLLTQVFAKNCLDCHSPPYPEANLDLTSLEVSRKRIADIYLKAVITQTMPLDPYEPLGEKEKRVISEWIIGGMLE